MPGERLIYLLLFWSSCFFGLQYTEVLAEVSPTSVVFEAPETSLILPPSPSPLPSPSPSIQNILGLRLEFTIIQGTVPSNQTDMFLSSLSLFIQQALFEVLLNSSTVQVLSMTECGSSCFRVDFIVSVTEGAIDSVMNDSLSVGERRDFQAMWPEISLVLSSFRVSGNGLDPMCEDYVGRNYDCQSSLLECPPNLTCLDSNLLPSSQQIPCSCDALQGIFNCNTFIQSICASSSATTPPTTTFPTIPPTVLPNWVIPVAVCGGAGLLIILTILALSLCCCCCFCRKSKKSVYFTEEGRKPHELSAYIYKNKGLVTYHNTGDVEDEGLNLGGDDATFQRTTTFTFNVGQQRPLRSPSPPPDMVPPPPPEDDY